MNTKQTYNSQIHNRRSLRLIGYDYSQTGAYFVTICCKGMKCRFGQIDNDEMILNEFGLIAYDEWVKLPERFHSIELDVFQIMPNHVHGIIVIKELISDHRIGEIIGAYKSLVSNDCLDICKIRNKTMGKLWHRNYFEHIICDERSYQNISEYIINNPANWNDDRFFAGKNV